jgi:hypothetical protein
VRQQIMRLTLIALVALLATGCAAVGSPASPSYPDPQESAVMRGNISEIVPAEGDGPSLGSIRVEGEKIEDNPFPVAIVYVNDGPVSSGMRTENRSRCPLPIWPLDRRSA